VAGQGKMPSADQILFVNVTTTVAAAALTAAAAVSTTKSGSGNAARGYTNSDDDAGMGTEAVANISGSLVEGLTTVTAALSTAQADKDSAGECEGAVEELHASILGLQLAVPEWEVISTMIVFHFITNNNG